MTTDARKLFPFILVPLLALLFLTLVTATGSWVAGGLATVLGLGLLLSVLTRPRGRRGGRGSSGDAAFYSWAGDSGCDSGGGSGGDGGGCGGE